MVIALVPVLSVPQFESDYGFYDKAFLKECLWNTVYDS